MGKLDEIVALKKEFDFRLLVDDAHGFGTMGKTGAGTPEHFGVQEELIFTLELLQKQWPELVVLLHAKQIFVTYLRYNMRSQTFAKSLPMPMAIGALKRLEMIRTKPEFREKLWTSC